MILPKVIYMENRRCLDTSGRKRNTKTPLCRFALTERSLRLLEFCEKVFA